MVLFLYIKGTCMHHMSGRCWREGAVWSSRCFLELSKISTRDVVKAGAYCKSCFAQLFIQHALPLSSSLWFVSQTWRHVLDSHKVRLSLWPVATWNLILLSMSETLSGQGVRSWLLIPYSCFIWDLFVNQTTNNVWSIKALNPKIKFGPPYIIHPHIQGTLPFEGMYATS